MDAHTTEAGETVHVDREEEHVGSEGPFHAVYRDPEAEEPYGYLCSACDTVNVAMDTMGRIVCNECGNTKKPDEWDAAHE